MSVATENSVKTHTAGGLGVTEYSFDFKIQSAESLQVTHIDADGVETVLSYAAGDFTVEGINLDAGAITLAVGVVGGTLSIERLTAYTTDTVFIEGSRFPATAIRTLTDQLTMMIQQLKERVDRSIQAPMTEDVINFEFPPLADRLSSYLIFDSSGALTVDNGVFPGSYFAAYSFDEDDIIQYDGKLFISLQDSNSNNIPPSSGETVWWREYSTAAEGGLPNYIDNRAAYINLDEGFTADAPNTSSPIKVGGDVKIVKDAADRDGLGFYWDIEVSETDQSSLLQIGFSIKSDDTDKLRVKLIALDPDPDVVLYDGDIATLSTYNSASDIYLFSDWPRTSSSVNYRLYFYVDSTSAAAMTWNLSDISLGQPYRLTAPSSGDLVGEIKQFPTYKDRSADDLLPFAFDNAVNQAEYAELYAEIGHMYNAQHVSAGDTDLSASTTLFYPTPIPGAYNRVGLPDIDITNASFSNIGGNLGITDLALSSDRLRWGTQFIIHITSGTLPTGLADGDSVYVRTDASGVSWIYLSEATALSATSPVAYTNSGSGTFRLTQEGISLDDAFQGHQHDAKTGAGAYSANSGIIFSGSSPGPIDTTPDKYIQDPHSDGTNGTPRTSNETRPTTYITFGYIRYRSVRSVELMASQTNREDVGTLYIDYEVPVGGKNRMDDLVMDGATTFDLASYPQINAIKDELDGVFITVTGSQFTTVDLSDRFMKQLGTHDSGTADALGGLYEDQFQGHWHDIKGWYGSGTPDNKIASVDNVSSENVANTGVYDPITDGTNGTPRTGTKTYPEHIAVYYYLRTKSLSSVILAQMPTDPFVEHEITDTTDVVYTLANLDTKEEYTFNRHGTGTGVLQLTGDVYWPDGTASTDLELEGDGQITLCYAGAKWRVKSFTDSGGVYATGEWVKDINGVLILKQEVIGGAFAYDTNTLGHEMYNINYRCVASNNVSESASDITYKFTNKTTTTVGVVGTVSSTYTPSPGDAIIIGRFRA